MLAVSLPRIGTALLAASSRFPLGLGRQAGAAPRAEGHGTLPGALGYGVVSKPRLGREAAIHNPNACIRIVHLDERPIIAAAAPQAICVRSLNVVRAQLARAHIALGRNLQRVEEGRELRVGHLVGIDQEGIERNPVQRPRARWPVSRSDRIAAALDRDHRSLQGSLRHSDGLD